MHDSTLALTHALTLAAGGWAVFPCRIDKSPATHGFHDASADPEQVRKLWAEYPGTLVGIATGAASGIAVLDSDTHSPDPKKAASARAWEAEYAARLPATYTPQTRSGGMHRVLGHRVVSPVVV